MGRGGAVRTSAPLRIFALWQRDLLSRHWIRRTGACAQSDSRAAPVLMCTHAAVRAARLFQRHALVFIYFAVTAICAAVVFPWQI